VDALTMRIVDACINVPTILRVLFLVAIITPSVGSIMIVLGIASWQGTARLFEVKCW
jgi:ABC-type dipeptide/oligopeptide/nickel transport system permease subunit